MNAAHPLSRLVALAVVVQMALTLTHPIPLALMLALVLVAGVAARAGRALAALGGLLLGMPLVSMLLWTVVFPRYGRLTIDSMLFGLGMGLRLGVILVAGVIFVVSTRPEDIGAMLTRVGVPFRVAFSFTLALRLFPLFADSARTIVLAQRSRGIEFYAGGPLGRLRRFVPLLVPIVACALRQSDRLSVALDTRGFGRAGRRTAFQVHRFGAADARLLAGLALADLAVIWLRLSGWGTIV